MMHGQEIQQPVVLEYFNPAPMAQPAELKAEQRFQRLTEDELDIIRWEGEGGQ